MRRVGEIALISDYLASLASPLGSFGLTDDAALLTGIPAAGLVVTTDALVAGIHFFEDDDPGDAAYKALAVNVSDLAAKAAKPAAYTMALALSEAPDEQWAKRLTSGLARAQNKFGIGLIGGDTVSTRAPWWISITAFGYASPRGLVPRGGARPGDFLYVTGTLGDAALGLQLRLQKLPFAPTLSASQRGHLLHRYLYPDARLGLSEALATHASAAMDVSDGLALDLSRMCSVSQTSASVLVSKIPLSEAAKTLTIASPEAFYSVLTGGDDYEILAAVPQDSASAFEAASFGAGVTVTRIGTVEVGSEAPRFIMADGTLMQLQTRGFEHFKV
jgi:thiamine-monophosphate kinase